MQIYAIQQQKQLTDTDNGIKMARLQANPHRPTPSLFLTNSQSLVNKMDKIRLRITSRCMDSCVMVMTETCLNSTIPNAAIEVAGGSVYRADGTADFGKNKGGGVCIC